MPTGKQRSGLNNLAYMGVEPSAPPQVLIVDRDPTANDYEHNIGTIWLTMAPAFAVWILMGRPLHVAQWVQLYPGAGGGASNFPCDVGIATEAGGTLNILSGALLTTTGVGDTVTITHDSGADGQVVIGATGGFPAFADLTSIGGTVTFTQGPNTLNLEASAGIVSCPCDDATTATPIAGVMNVLTNGGIIYTSGGVPGTLSFNWVNGTDGQLLIGGGITSAWANITSPLGTINITNGPNSIAMDVKTGLAFSASLPSAIAGNPVYTLLGTGAQFEYELGGQTAAGGDPSYAYNAIYDPFGAFYLGDGTTSAFFTAPFDGIFEFNVKVPYRRTSNAFFLLASLMRATGSTTQEFYFCPEGENHDGSDTFFTIDHTERISLISGDRVHFNLVVSSNSAAGQNFFIYGNSGYSKGTSIPGYGATVYTTTISGCAIV